MNRPPVTRIGLLIRNALEAAFDSLDLSKGDAASKLLVSQGMKLESLTKIPKEDVHAFFMYINARADKNLERATGHNRDWWLNTSEAMP